MPHNPEFRVELVSIFCIRTLRVEDVATDTKREGHVFQERDIGIHIKVDVRGVPREGTHSGLRPRSNGRRREVQLRSKVLLCLYIKISYATGKIQVARAEEVLNLAAQSGLIIESYIERREHRRNWSMQARVS